jgi:hypothetical protein
MMMQLTQRIQSKLLERFFPGASGFVLLASPSRLSELLVRFYGD